MSVWTNAAGHILWKDHGTGSAGTVIDAAAVLWRCTAGEAIRTLVQNAGVEAATPRPCNKPAPPGGSASITQNPAVPTPDRERLSFFIAEARRCALEGHPSAVRFALGRGLDLHLIADRYHVGFLPEVRFPQWRGRTLSNTWVLPIADHKGQHVAAKLHLESRSPRQPKCLWAPFGTEPKKRPRHGFATLSPDPDTDSMKERMAIREYDAGLSGAEAERRTRSEAELLYLCPGELKALAVLSAGLCATSITAGEAHRWTPGHVALLNGRRVAILYDDDEQGRRFRHQTTEALRHVASELKAITFGRAS